MIEKGKNSLVSCHAAKRRKETMRKVRRSASEQKFGSSHDYRVHLKMSLDAETKTLLVYKVFFRYYFCTMYFFK